MNPELKDLLDFAFEKVHDEGEQVSVVFEGATYSIYLDKSGVAICRT